MRKTVLRPPANPPITKLLNTLSYSQLGDRGAANIVITDGLDARVALLKRCNHRRRTLFNRQAVAGRTRFSPVSPADRFQSDISAAAFAH